MNPWHDIALGDKLPEQVPAVVEVPRGSRNKYELDKDTGLLRVDRVLFSAVHYPANYGFIPRTFCEDDDPLDILILGQEAVYPLTILAARPVGLLKMTDQGKADDKIIAVHVNDPDYAGYSTLDELAPHRMEEIQRFFEDYKKLEFKEVSTDEFLGPEEARKAVEDAVQLYQRTFR